MSEDIIRGKELRLNEAAINQWGIRSMNCTHIAYSNLIPEVQIYGKFSMKKKYIK